MFQAQATSYDDTLASQPDPHNLPAQLLLLFLAGKDCLTAQDPPAGVRHQPLHLEAYWPQQSAHPLAIKLCNTGNLLTYLAAGMHSSCAVALAWEYYLLVYKLHAFTFTMLIVIGGLSSASKLASTNQSHHV